MSCQRGCRNGVVSFFDADGIEYGRLCACQRERNAAEFRDGYSPGGVTQKAQNRRERRDAARTKDFQMGRQFSRKSFRRRWDQLQRECGKYQAPGATRAAYDRAERTRWVALQGIVRRARVSGVVFDTTNRQRADQYAQDGRERDIRTIQRCHRDLEAMGYVWVKHRRRSGAARIPGQLDYLRIIVRSPYRACVMPHVVEQSNRGADHPRPLDSSFEPARTDHDKDPPPAAPDDTPASAGDDRATGEAAELRRAIAFQQQKLDAGWNPDRVHAELRRLRQLLRLSEGGPP
jgi:hypothetical protein